MSLATKSTVTATAAAFIVSLLPMSLRAQTEPSYDTTVEWLTSKNPVGKSDLREAGNRYQSAWTIDIREQCTLSIVERALTIYRRRGNSNYEEEQRTMQTIPLAHVDLTGISGFGGEWEEGWRHGWKRGRYDITIRANRDRGKVAVRRFLVTEGSQREIQAPYQTDYARLPVSHSPRVGGPLGPRILKAIQHLATLCGAVEGPALNPEPF